MTIASNLSDVRHLIGIVGDIHISDKPPTNCTESYNDDLFEMLTEVGDIAGRRQLSAVVLAGDVFHIKRPDRTSHRTVQRLIDVLQAYPCPVYMVIGNHDIQQDRLDSVFETQPFGVLLQAGMRLLSGWDFELPVYGVSWQQDWHDAEEAFKEWGGGAPHDQALIVTHAPLYPPGQENPFENVPASVVAGWAGKKGYLYYGHVHDYHGVFETDGVVFCNQGSLSRGSLHESDLTRKPAITIWHSDRSGPEAFERVELKAAKPAEEVFRLVEHAERVDYRERLDAFLASVASTKVDATSVESVISHVRSLELGRAETDLAVEVLEQAASGELKA